MSNLTVWSLLALAPVGCTKDDPVDDGVADVDTDTDVDPPTGETGTTGPTGETGTTPTGDTAPPEPFDCSAIPTDPIAINRISGARGYHGLAFDTLGNIFGSDGNALLKADYYGTVNVIVPGLGTIQGMDWLADGGLVVASDQNYALARVDTTTGGTSPVATDIGAYGVVVGPNGLVYAADRSQVYRIDPATGVKEVFVANDAGFNPQSVNFSPDFSKFYMTSQSGWALWEMDLDANLERSSPKRHLANFGNSFRDGLAVDYCGNLYVPDYGDRKLFRISPTGQVGILVDFQQLENYGHFAVFGSGIGGWKHDALYLPQPYNNNQVIEIEIGVPSRSWVF